MYNQIQLMGNVTRDPEPKRINNKEFIQFDIAVYKSQQESMFIRCKAWEKQATALSGIKKGDRLIVSGKLDQENWEDKEGKKMSKIVVVVYNSARIQKKVIDVNDDNFGMEDQF